MTEAPNFLALYIGAGSTVCLGSMLLLYNVVALVGHMKTPEPASGLAKGAWGLSIAALLLGPCVWLIGGVVALVIAKIERGRIYKDESPLSSATPARMAGLNGVMMMLLFAVTLIAAVITAV